MKRLSPTPPFFASIFLVSLTTLLPSHFPTAFAAPPAPQPPALKGTWGDQGNGTYSNPIVPSDYSDTDAIRVGDDYYAISSTFQYSPGVVILHSKDLVNWTILSHAVPDPTQIGPEMNFDKMDRYGKGVWAGAIRYHDKKFYIYFGTPAEGFFVTTATDPAGPWEPLTHVMKAEGWDDCCPFWDDDGTGYFVASNFADKYKIHLFKLAPDGKSILPGYDQVLHQSRGSEANKLYKINGTYYHFFSQVTGEGRVVMMKRAKSIEGPWEPAEGKQLIHVAKAIDKDPNQGGLLDLPTTKDLSNGNWWFLTHQGTGDWEGRALCLLPVTWIEGWPILGTPGADGIGTMPWSYKKPNLPSQPVASPQTSDDFGSASLSPQWEWNYHPRPGSWSLTEKPGYLRLRAGPALKANDLLKVPNILTQRVLRTPENTATVKIDLTGMSNGQHAGLAHLARAYSALDLSKANDSVTLSYVQQAKLQEAGPAPVTIAGTTVYLRTTWDYAGTSQYSYSTDGTSFTALGPVYKLTWSFYRGDRLGLYTYNNEKAEGFVDIDGFTYTHSPQTARVP